MNTGKRLLILLLLIGSAATAGYYYLRSRTPGESDRIRLWGNIEVTTVEAGFKLAGRVETRELTEGQTVKAGQVLARLDSRELAHDVALREANVRLAQAVLAELQAGSRPEEIAAGEAALDAAKAEASRAELEFARQKDLLAQKVTTASGYEAAEAALNSARARVRECTERFALLRRGPRVEQIEQAKARLEAAQAALALSQTRRNDAILASPLSGVVLSKNIEPGEFVAPGTPVVTIGDLEHPWLRAYIQETDLSRVKLGQAAVVTTDGHPGKRYQGRVAFIAAEAEFTPKSIQTTKERVRLVYRIKVDLPNPNLELKPGMPAEAELMTTR